MKIYSLLIIFVIISASNCFTSISNEEVFHTIESEDFPLNNLIRLARGVVHYDQILFSSYDLNLIKSLKNLSREELVSICKDLIPLYPRITKYDALVFDVLSRKDILTFPEVSVSLESFHRVELGHIALALEYYQKLTYDQTRRGGLNDYIMSLSAPEIIEQIIIIMNKCPELYHQGVIFEAVDLYNKSKGSLRGGALEYFTSLTIEEIRVIYEENKFWFSRRHPQSKLHDIENLKSSGSLNNEDVIRDISMEIKDLILYFDNYRTESGAFEKANHIYHGGIKVHLSSLRTEELIQIACAIAYECPSKKNELLDRLTSIINSTNESEGLFNFIIGSFSKKNNYNYVKAGVLESLVEKNPRCKLFSKH